MSGEVDRAGVDERECEIAIRPSDVANYELNVSAPIRIDERDLPQISLAVAKGAPERLAKPV